MNRYEAIYKKNSNRLPYYKPYLGLLNDHRTLAGLLSDPKKIIATPCFRQYSDMDGTTRSVEEWMREMSLYEFEPLEFIDESTKKGETSYFENEYDHCIPAFSEGQARALYLAHIATNTTDTILAEDIRRHFTGFIGKPSLKDVWKVSKYDEFIPPYYWEDEQIDDGRFYTKDEKGLAMFYLDFFLKYGFERELFPEGTVPVEIQSTGNIYQHRIPFTLAINPDELEACDRQDGR